MSQFDQRDQHIEGDQYNAANDINVNYYGGYPLTPKQRARSAMWLEQNTSTRWLRLSEMLIGVFLSIGSFLFVCIAFSGPNTEIAWVWFLVVLALGGILLFDYTRWERKHLAAYYNKQQKTARSHMDG